MDTNISRSSTSSSSSALSPSSYADGADIDDDEDDDDKNNKYKYINSTSSNNNTNTNNDTNTNISSSREYVNVSSSSNSSSSSSSFTFEPEIALFDDEFANSSSSAAAAAATPAPPTPSPSPSSSPINFTGSFVLVNATECCLDISNNASSTSGVTSGVADDGYTLEPEVVYNWYFLLLLSFVAAGVLGNTLVCLAICLERRLQNVTNYFLLSLAVADLLVSVVVMPFGIIVGFIGHWPFGVVVCNVYVTCDVLACSSSIMHMCFISVGRYMGIRNPLKTRHTSKKMVGVKIVLVWLLSMVISSPITVLGAMDAVNIQPEVTVCAIQNRFFFVFGSLFAFYVPMVIMVVSYVLTVQLLRQQKKFGDDLHASRRVQLSRKRHHQQLCRRQPLELASNLHQRDESLLSDSLRLQTASKQLMAPTRGDSGNVTSNNNGHVNVYRKARVRKATTSCDQSTQTSPRASSRATSSGDGNNQRLVRLRSMRLNLRKRRLRFLTIRKRSRSSRAMVGNSVANEQKASKVLGIVFLTFVVCWAPFFVLNIVYAVCPACHVSDDIVDTCLWLGYVSSTINPVIYTIFNRTFKEAFIRLLRCRCCSSAARRQRRRHYGRQYWSSTQSRSGVGGGDRYIDALAQTPTSANDDDDDEDDGDDRVVGLPSSSTVIWTSANESIC